MTTFARVSALVLIPFLLLLTNCAKESAISATCCVYPDVSISYKPRLSSDDTITLSQTGTTVNLMQGARGRKLPSERSYQLLLEALFESPKWQAEAVPEFHQGPWSGRPRQILILERGEKGLFLSGEDVPEEWVSALLRFTRKNLP